MAIFKKCIYVLQGVLAQRTLVAELVRKDLRVRYTRSLFGFFWIVLSPLLLVGIFYFVFSAIFKISIKEAPFLLYLTSAIFPWNFFSSSVTTSTTSLLDNHSLAQEAGFTHYLMPVAIVIVNLICFLPSLAVTIVAILVTSKQVPAYIFLLPAVALIHLIITIAISIIVSVVYVRFRDIKYILEALLTIIFYLTPVFYSPSLVKASFSGCLFDLYLWNPFVGIVNLYRLALINGYHSFIKAEMGFFATIVSPLLFAIISVITAVIFYQKQKRRINDYLSY